MKFDVIVIGGGASGMIAAGRAAERGRGVLLLEKNADVGAKLSITGGGRCNITNHEPDIHALLGHYGVAKPFLYSSFAQFGVEQTFSFFESLGVSLVTQAHRRVFPVSEQAGDVVEALKQYMKRQGVEVRTNARVERVNMLDGRISAVMVNGERLEADSYILATGGTSHPETGSTGDGFSWLAMLGHTVRESTPTIVPLATTDEWIHRLAGVVLRGVRMNVFLDGIKNISIDGDILCTHFGLSGPRILNSAGVIADLLHAGEVTAVIDAYPREDIGAYDARIVAVFDANKNKELKNVWNEIAPEGSGPAILPLLGDIQSDAKVHSITKEQRRKIIDTLKALPVSISGLMGSDRAVIADGGVSLEEIDMKTMRSLRVPNVFVTGDLLHITRPSGGYSLQLCWTTGFVAGSNA